MKHDSVKSKSTFKNKDALNLNYPEHGDYPVGKRLLKPYQMGQSGSFTRTRVGNTSTSNTGVCSKKRNPAKYEPQRQLLGQRIHGIFLVCSKSALLYLQELKSVKHFEQEWIANLDYYNNRRMKAKRKGVLPAIHRQQALFRLLEQISLKSIA